MSKINNSFTFKGSRAPNYKYVKECLNLNDAESEELISVTSIGDAFIQSDNIIFLAVSASYETYDKILNEFIQSLKMKLLDKRMILVDVSNSVSTKKNQTKLSNAEKLKNLLEAKLAESNLKNVPISVVKGFNLVNAYQMSSNEIKGSIETVPIAGDDYKAKEDICKVCNQIGFQALDVGFLKNAFQLEYSNNSTFSEWKYPSLICILFFIINFFWTFMMYFFFPKKKKSFEKFLKDFSLMSHLNKVAGFTGLQLLAFVYFAGVIASIYQLKNRTKYKLFPRYLDFWLKSRKQFGLWAFLIASFHVLMTIFITNPSYLAEWYRKVDNSTSANAFGLTHMKLHGEINVLTGIAAYILMSLVGLSSINSIANSFNWREWVMVQSKLGISCLFVSFIHDLSMYLRIFLSRNENSFNTVYLLTRIKLIGLYFPLLVLLLRLIFSCFSPISKRVKKIRSGINL